MQGREELSGKEPKYSDQPVSSELGQAIMKLWDILQNEFGGDSAFQIMGRGKIVAASTMQLGVIHPSTKEKLDIRLVTSKECMGTFVFTVSVPTGTPYPTLVSRVATFLKNQGIDIGDVDYLSNGLRNHNGRDFYTAVVDK